MKISLNTNTSFKGYKNVVANIIDEPNYSLVYIGMQLDNEGGHRDLDKYNELLKSIQPFYDGKDNIFTFTSANYFGKTKLLFDTYELSKDKELTRLSKKLPPEQFHQYEAATLKIYTFVAQLLRRVSEGYIPKSDALGTAKVIARFLSTTMDYYRDNDEYIQRFINQTVKCKIPPQDIAEIFNKGIKGMMARYFA